MWAPLALDLWSRLADAFAADGFVLTADVGGLRCEDLLRTLLYSAPAVYRVLSEVRGLALAFAARAASERKPAPSERKPVAAAPALPGDALDYEALMY